MPTLLLNRDTVKQLLDMGEVIRAVEEAFVDFGRGKAIMPPKAYLPLDKGDFRAMPAAVPGAAGMKWVNVHPGNRAQGLPTVMAVLIYSDPLTGYPLAIMDATEITAYRTGATAAIASKYLARRDSRTLGIIGAGGQAVTQILAHACLFNLISIKVYDKSDETVRRIIGELPGYPLEKHPLEEACDADIICTLTPSREPLLKKNFIRPGTHINAVGADAAGKQELEASLLREALVVVDDIRQAGAAGEINVPLSKGSFTVEEIHGTLAEVILGEKQGRTDDKAVTIFDSTGVAIEDIAAARLVYLRAVNNHLRSYIDLI